MMSMKLIGSIWLVMAMATVAQDSVLDTSGQALQSGVDYYIKPAVTDNGGRFTLINRNDSCPLYVGQENTSLPEGYPVTFAPFAEGDTLVREGRDQKITFSALTFCAQSTAWKLGEKQSETQRTLIVTGIDETDSPIGHIGNYFNIIKLQADLEGVYGLQWCPTEACPICRLNCEAVGVGVLVENNKRLLALDRSPLPVVFERAYITEQLNRI